MNKPNCCEKCLGLQKVYVCVNLRCECHMAETTAESSKICDCGIKPTAHYHPTNALSEYETGYKTGIKEMYALYHQQTSEWAHAEIEKIEREKRMNTKKDM